MTRIGKIARLPQEIRERLNQRLNDGQQAKDLVKWLNKLPEVNAILKKEFHSSPIKAGNLTEWKNGGYEDWKREQAIGRQLGAITGITPEILRSQQGGVIDQMAVFFAAHMLASLKTLPDSADPDKTAKLWRELRISFSAMRRYQYYSTLLTERQAKLTPPADQAEQKKPLSEKEKKDAIDQIFGLHRYRADWDNVRKRYVGPGSKWREHQTKLAHIEQMKEAAAFHSLNAIEKAEKAGDLDAAARIAADLDVKYQNEKIWESFTVAEHQNDIQKARQAVAQHDALLAKTQSDPIRPNSTEFD
ncbi:MAG: hypothetical protein ABSH38_16470 [Verrucomicrobiota bacterium]|jgi:hypothetical protein